MLPRMSRHICAPQAKHGSTWGVRQNAQCLQAEPYQSAYARATSALALPSTRTHAAESSIVLVAADKLPVLAKALTKVGPSVFLC